MAEITEAESRGSFSSSSSSGRGNTRNLVFLDGESLASHRLFDRNTYVISATTQYPTRDSDKERESQTKSEKSVTQWLVYQVLKADTNGDGQIDAADQQTLGVTDAAGNGYAEILLGVDQFFGMTMVSAGQLVVVYSHGGAKSVAVIDLANRKVTLTKPLADLGPDVK